MPCAPPPLRCPFRSGTGDTCRKVSGEFADAKSQYAHATESCELRRCCMAHANLQRWLPIQERIQSGLHSPEWSNFPRNYLRVPAARGHAKKQKHRQTKQHPRIMIICISSYSTSNAARKRRTGCSSRYDVRALARTCAHAPHSRFDRPRSGDLQVARPEIEAQNSDGYTSPAVISAIAHRHTHYINTCAASHHR